MKEGSESTMDQTYIAVLAQPKSIEVLRKIGEKSRKRLKCRLLDVYADLWRRRALLMAAGVSSPARFGPYSTRAFIASVR